MFIMADKTQGRSQERIEIERDNQRAMGQHAAAVRVTAENLFFSR